MCRKNNALVMPLVDNPRKYKYRPQPMSDEGVLFLLLTIKEMEHLKLYHFLKLTEPRLQSNILHGMVNTYLRIRTQLSMLVSVVYDYLY